MIDHHFLSALSHWCKKHQLILLLLITTFLLYAPSIGNDFVNLDDPLLVTENPIVRSPSLSSIGAAFTSYDPELYIPVTLLSFQAEAWTLGMKSWHFHLFNILLFLGCIGLVYSVVKKLTENEAVALLTAALFAIHPINSEAVLWVSARKDVLSAFFFLLSWQLWMKSLQGQRTFFYTSILIFALALFSKISAITLPIVLILTLWHLQAPITHKRWKELIPFASLSIVFGIIALFGKTTVLAKEQGWTLLTMALRSVSFYLQLLAVPFGQSAVHPLLNEAPPRAIVLLVLAASLVFLISILAWKTRKNTRIVIMGWLYMLLTLSPTFLHYTRGNTELMIASERYFLLPSFGIFLMLAIGALWLYRHPSISALTRKFLILALAILFIVYGILVQKRINVFGNSINFNTDIISQSPEYASAHYNLALAFEEDRKPQNAEDEYDMAIMLRPTYANAAMSKGILLLREKRISEALEMLTEATRMRPEYYKTYYNLGIAYMQLGRYSDAVVPLEKVNELFPDFPEARKNLATVYGKLERFSDALNQYKILATIDPTFREQWEKIRPK